MKGPDYVLLRLVHPGSSFIWKIYPTLYISIYIRGVFLTLNSAMKGPDYVLLRLVHPGSSFIWKIYRTILARIGSHFHSHSNTVVENIIVGSRCYGGTCNISHIVVLYQTNLISSNN